MARGEQVHLVTQARRPLSEDIKYRQNRYLLMMGIRVLCFAVAIVLYLCHQRWLILIPAIGAVIIPYVAVVFANGGREPDNQRGFLEHRTDLLAPPKPTPPPAAPRDPSDVDR
jgi:Protein of unknown function (DUF3099)